MWNGVFTREPLPAALLLAAIAFLILTLSPALGAGDSASSSSGGSELTFLPDADAEVDEVSPKKNFGRTQSLRTNAGSEPDVESYLRFRVKGITSGVQRVTLRLYAQTETVDGPAVYPTTTTWSESRITWKNRPGSKGSALADSGAIRPGTWVEFDVTRLVTGDGTYAFRLATSSEDGIDFSSRERAGSEPRLVVATGSPVRDTTPPTAPTALRTTGISPSTIALAWTASSDDVGVSGYGIYVDGSLVGYSSDTSFTVNALACGSSYTIKVDAVDRAGNRSVLSAGLLASSEACAQQSGFYVSPAGSDANPGSLDRPWRTLAKAIATLAAGQTAYVRAGTYEEAVGGSCGSSYNVLTWSATGTAGAPITISGYPGEERRVVVKTKLKLTGNHLRLVNLVADRNRAYSSFDKACTGEPNVNVYGDDVELGGLEVRDSNMSGIYLEGADRVKILRNWIHDNGAHAKFDHGIYYASGSGGTIANNVIERNLAFGIQMYPRPSGQVITQNTIVKSGKAGIVLDGASNLVVANNISAWNVEQGIRTSSGGCVGCVADRNVLYGNSSDYYLPQPLSILSTMSADPLFVDRTAGNYHLLAGSPAVDRARADHSLGTDFDNRNRPQGAAPDIGSFER